MSPAPTLIAGSLPAMERRLAVIAGHISGSSLTGGRNAPSTAEGHIERVATAAAPCSRDGGGNPGSDGPPYPGSMRVSAEVQRALREGRAVVALESTIVAHGEGLPAPALPI